MSFSENYITICQKQLYYKLLNPKWMDVSDYLFVFLHEGLGSVEQWKDFPDEISRLTHLPVLLYDRYGYGKSEILAHPRNCDYLTIEAAEFLPDLLNRLKIDKKLILFGHSDGGSIALIYSSLFPENVAGVITEADHIFCEEITYQGIKDALFAFENGKLKNTLEKFHGDKAHSMFHGWSDVWLDTNNKEWSLEHFLPNIVAPVLVIQGDGDCYGTERQMLVKKELISGPVELLLIDNCGHVPHVQARKLVVEKSMHWIEHNVTKCKPLNY
jgi:pimeloyl-ACP methyl ester carboxylesterase